MNLLFLISGFQVPSSRFRILQYLPYLRSRGHQCTVLPSRPPKYRGLRCLGNRLSEAVRVVSRAWDYQWAAGRQFDVIVVERELFSSRLSFLEGWFRRLSPRMILDVDDGLFVQHPAKFEKLVRLSDHVIVGNELLRQQVSERHSPTTLIPTCLDLQRYTRKPCLHSASATRRRLVLGWTGVADNYRHLRLLEEPLRKLAREVDFEVCLIAERPPTPQDFDIAAFPLQFRPWTPDREIEDLQRFDIGLMPLQDTPWTRYKCGLKILQYMAVGIPCVASPVGVNAEIVRDRENGRVARTAEQWSCALRSLMDSPQLRQQLGAAGRETVEQRYSIEVHSSRFEAVLQGETVSSDLVPTSGE